jgi:hypothetical protein
VPSVLFYGENRGKFLNKTVILILRRRILRPDNSSPENSSLEKMFPGDGKFFAVKFFARMILRQRILRYSYFFVRAENSSPENFSPGNFFAKNILR